MKDYKKLSEKFNLLRIKYNDKKFSGEEMNLLLKEFPMGNHWLKFWVQEACIIKLGKNIYTFPQFPVHWTLIKAAIEAARKKQSSYTKKYMENKKETQKTIEEAIVLLKKNGYKILKKEIKWKEL